MKNRSFNCPAEMTIALIGGKWKAILIYNLRRGSMRFGELRRRSPGITQATLAHQLRELESSGLIKRLALGKDPIAGVAYSLTERGKSLRPVINTMVRWGIENQREYAMGEFGMAVFQ